MALVVGLSGCASQQRLSASIYHHQVAAYTLAARGDYVGAAAHERAADEDREKLNHSGRSWLPVYPR